MGAGEGGGERYRKPAVKNELSEDMTIALRLASSKWWGGDPGAVLSAPADQVMWAVHYEDFKSSYETEMIRINKPEGT